MIYGYARCSTNESRQDINRQKRELKKLGVLDEKQIYWEYESGTVANRPELGKLIDTITEGDTIVTTEVSRLTRSTKQLCELLQLVQNKHLQLIIGSFVVDCRTDNVDPMTKGMLMMWGVFSEMERDMISQRVKSGMQNAKAKGKQIGRPKITAEDVPDKFCKYQRLYKQGQITIADIARLMECSRTTIYKYLQLCQSEE